MATNRQNLKLFNGRDHSWMQFNRRVLEEAEEPSNPLLERVKFLAITGSNLDEYVEIRQAGLMQRIEDGYSEMGFDGLRPDESLAMLTTEIHSFVAAQYRCWNHQLLPQLRQQGIRLLDWKELSEEARAFAQNYFQREVDPLLTPIAIDPAHPFPRVLNKALCLALLLRRKRRSSGPQVLGVVTVPRALPRFVRLPSAGGTLDYLLLQDLIARNLAGMYRGYELLAHTAFRVPVARRYPPAAVARGEGLLLQVAEPLKDRRRVVEAGHADHLAQSEARDDRPRAVAGAHERRHAGSSGERPRAVELALDHARQADHRPHAGALDLGRQRLERFPAPAGDQDLGALGGEPLTVHASSAPSGAGHHHHLAEQSRHRGILTSSKPL